MKTVMKLKYQRDTITAGINQKSSQIPQLMIKRYHREADSWKVTPNTSSCPGYEVFPVTIKPVDLIV